MLLVVLILAGVFALLSAQLLADVETVLRGRANGSRLDRAGSAACSGVEWAAARIATVGEVATTATVPLGDDTHARVRIVPGGNPNVVAEGRCGGTAVSVDATVERLAAAFPYRFACFSGTSSSTKAITLEGPAWFGHPSQPFDTTGWGTSTAVTMHGDLDLAATAALPPTFVSHVSGRTRLGRAPVGQAVWDTGVFLGMTSGGVPVHRYSGNNVSIGSTTLTGIVVIDATAGGTITLDNLVVDGTVVVHAPYNAAPVETTWTSLMLRRTVTINGGTALTGNLALLAPGCQVNVQANPAINLTGVTYVGCYLRTDGLSATGMMLCRGNFPATNAFRLAVPAGWSPDLPLGLTLPPVYSWWIRWLGRS